MREVVSGPRIGTTSSAVRSRPKIAPTILALLGLDAGVLQAVAVEHTATLARQRRTLSRWPGRRTSYLAE